MTRTTDTCSAALFSETEDEHRPSPGGHLTRWGARCSRMTVSNGEAVLAAAGVGSSAESSVESGDGIGDWSGAVTPAGCATQDTVPVTPVTEH